MRGDGTFSGDLNNWMLPTSVESKPNKVEKRKMVPARRGRLGGEEMKDMCGELAAQGK